MSSGYIFLYFGNDVVPNVATFEKLFEPIGLRIENPDTREVLAISPAGDQEITTREAIETQLASRRSTSIQWWYSESEDVYCRFNPRSANGQWSVELGLDGVGSQNADALIETMVHFFTGRCAQGDAFALVVDKTGEFEEIDWESVIEAKQRLQCVPDILFLPSSVRTPGFDDVREEMNGCPQHVRLKRHR